MSRYGVIDLGSNTFHLLIVEAVDQNKFRTVFRKRVFTSLSDGGIELIKEERMVTGLASLRDFKDIISSHNCSKLKVIGTAVLRSASNRLEFISKAEKILNTEIIIIDGIQEAEYIYKGITLLPEANFGTHLIMDIGGGSTEFIIIRDGMKIFSKSYILGVGSLFEVFHKSDPISAVDLKEMENHIFNTVKDLIPLIHQYQPKYLTGASGSFEVLQLMYGQNPENDSVTAINPSEFKKIYNKIVKSDTKTREKMKGLPVERVKLIVVGMVLKNTIMNIVKPDYILVSPYALKEGVVREMMEF